jgi:hypothetical protein
MPQDFTNDELIALPFVISAARFSTYLRIENNDVRRALALYRWNVELSAAFFIPLQICEVLIRNATVEAIEAVHGPSWTSLKGFEYTLPKQPGYYSPQKDFITVTRRHTQVGQIIAELKFMFWQSMFTSGQDTRIWDKHLHQILPFLPVQATIGAARQIVYDEIDAVRRFRNRIAHHEPIFARDIAEEYQRIKSIVAWRSPDTAAWLDRTQLVTGILARRPRQILDGEEFQYPVR